MSTAGKISFSFGKNWNDFIKKYYSDDRLSEAVKSLKKISQRDSLQDKTFLDIGSGSGLFSLAAYKLGATRIESMDLDPFSIQTTNYVREHYGSNASLWSVQQGSILDEAWTRDHLHPADVVYSWGVLHHTGDMWQAITNAASFVAEGGLFIIAIYNKEGGLFSSRFWWHVKRFYNRMPAFIQSAMCGIYLAVHFTTPILVSPLKLRRRFWESVNYVRNYQSSRGMNRWTDIKDWLGGYPYEYATVDEIVSFVQKLGFSTMQVWPKDGKGCSEFLFVKNV